MATSPKHHTHADEISTSDLKEKWASTLSYYDEMIELGHPLRSIRFLVRHIIENGYDNYYFPGTSLFDLLISIPIDNKVNYSKTLRVGVDELRCEVKFVYRDWTGLSRGNTADLKKSFVWSETCQLTESIDTFEYFISTRPEWDPGTR